MRLLGTGRSAGRGPVGDGRRACRRCTRRPTPSPAPTPARSVSARRAGPIGPARLSELAWPRTQRADRRAGSGGVSEDLTGLPLSCWPNAAVGFGRPAQPALRPLAATAPIDCQVQTDLVLVVDFGAQYAQLIARRVREAHVYSEIVPHTMPVAEMLARDPTAIILSGGPSSVYADGAPPIDPALFDAGVPVLGICYGFQAMAQALGGEVAHTGGPSSAARR